jgi:hypothetical protein
MRTKDTIEEGRLTPSVAAFDPALRSSQNLINEPRGVASRRLDAQRQALIHAGIDLSVERPKIESSGLPFFVPSIGSKSSTVARSTRFRGMNADMDSREAALKSSDVHTSRALDVKIDFTKDMRQQRSNRRLERRLLHEDRAQSQHPCRKYIEPPRSSTKLNDVPRAATCVLGMLDSVSRVAGSPSRNHAILEALSQGIPGA